MRDSTWGISRTVAAVFGVVYILAGVLGFIQGAPFVTGDAPSGMESASGLLLGIFPINLLHNVAHIALGAVLLFGAWSRDAARGVLRGVGTAFLVLGVLGIVSPNGFGLLPLGGADIGLHLGTGAILLLASFLDRDRDDRREARTV